MQRGNVNDLVTPGSLSIPPGISPSKKFGSGKSQGKIKNSTKRGENRKFKKL